MSKPTAPPRWKRVPLPRAKHPFAITAHRGDHTVHPENSSAALEAAIRAGADFVELDLRTTRDNHIVVLHDRTVDRTTDGTGALQDLTLADARALILRPNPGTTAPRRPHRIPTFAEMLRAARGRIGFYLDCKEVDPEEAAALVRRHRVLDQSIVYANPDECVRWKKLVPEMPVMSSAPNRIRTPAELADWLDQYPVEVLDGSLPFHNSELVAAAHAHGAVVWPDCMHPSEGPALWDSARQMGVDGLQTDKPTEMVRWRRQTLRG